MTASAQNRQTRSSPRMVLDHDVLVLGDDRGGRLRARPAVDPGRWMRAIAALALTCRRRGEPRRVDRARGLMAPASAARHEFAHRALPADAATSAPAARRIPPCSSRRRLRRRCAAASPPCGRPRDRPRPRSCRASRTRRRSFCSESRIGRWPWRPPAISTSSNTFLSASESFAHTWLPTIVSSNSVMWPVSMMWLCTS